MEKINIMIPKNVKFIISTLKNEGYESYSVGGCVRDSILGREPQDWDITTNALPEHTMSIFKNKDIRVIETD